MHSTCGSCTGGQYAFADYNCVDRRLPFGRRSSAGLKNHTTSESASILPEALEAARKIRVRRPHVGSSTTSHPPRRPNVSRIQLSGGGRHDPFFCETYVDDPLLMESLLCDSDTRQLSVSQSAISEKLRVLGYRRGPGDPVLSPHKLTDSGTMQEV